MKMNVKVLIFSCICLAPKIFAPPMTYTVTLLTDTLPDGIPGELRFGINELNGNYPGPGATNVIDFAVAGTINPQADLPTIVQPILIDGYTAPGAVPNSNPINAPNNAIIAVTIQGPGAGLDLPTLNGLVLGGGSDGSTIRGLCINNFAAVLVGAFEFLYGAGIEIDANNCTISGNFIGTDNTGFVPYINCIGIDNFGNNNSIGGITNDLRNLLLGAINIDFGLTGVIVNQAFGPLQIINNTVGLTAAGDSAPPTGTNYGITSFGGPVTLTNNVISGHSAANVLMQFFTLQPQTIGFNIIGLDITGTLPILPRGNGIVIMSSINPFASEFVQPIIIQGNTISGNLTGILLGNTTAFSPVPIYSAQIFSNFIGTDVTGSMPVGNSMHGIWLAAAVDTRIDANLISGNSGHGILTTKAQNTTIQGNYIGTDFSQTRNLGNGLNGIKLGSVVAVGVPSFNDQVGGALSGNANYIMNNGQNGIELTSFTQQETIIGNIIAHNTLHGILIGPKARHNWIGGFRDAGTNLLGGNLTLEGYTNLGPIGTSNIITHNGQEGIAIEGSHNAIQANIITANDAAGITITDASHVLVGAPLGVQLAVVQEVSPLIPPVSTLPPTLGNTVTGNNGPGVAVVQSTGHAVDNSILSNAISDNNGNGIQLIG